MSAVDSVVVVGGTIREAAEWAHEEKLDKRQVKLVASELSVEGINPDRIVLVGRFWRRLDALKLYRRLRIIAAKNVPRVTIEDRTC